MEAAITQFVELIKWVADLIIRPINHLKELEHNMDLLKQKKDELVAKESDITTQLKRAGEKRKQPLEEVNVWLKRVKIIKDEVNKVERSLDQEEMIPHKYYSKFYSRIKLAELVVEKNRELDQLRGMEFPGGLVDEGSPVKTAILFDPPLLHGQSTAEETMDEIMELLLNNPEIGKIGVYGMGGIGKTTIMKHINNKLAEMTDFNRIIWVTVSKEVGGIREIQHKIAQALRKEFIDELSKLDDEVRRVAALLWELKRIGKFLIILDDLWKEITLQEVGIPQPNKENNCKVLVTTRDLKVCNSIETQKIVRVKCLSDKEAWDLFVSKVGDHILANNNPEIETVARQVVGECAGLPLAIITIGAAMRGRQHIRAWRYALNQLRSSTTAKSNDDLGMEDKVFKLLRFSYDNLRPLVQECFLYCAFFPEDYSILSDKLIKYWVAEGYIEEEAGIDDQYDTWDADAQIKGFHILQELEDACMLEVIQKLSDERELLRMHDLVRDLANKIMREDYRFLAKPGLQLKELPKEAWEKATKISLMKNKMVIFPEQLNCPSLSTLLLHDNNKDRVYSHQSETMVFPPCFFSQMSALRVLDLSYSSCKELPTSLSNLVELRYLNLSKTEIRELPQEMGKLLNLRYLKLSLTKIRELPQEMGALLNLRYLNLSRSNIRELPQEMAKLLNLRYLKLSRTKIRELPQEMGELSLNLRYLNLSFTKIREVPQEMGKLLNLRYLNLSYTGIREVPQEMGALVRLRFLYLTGTLLHTIHVNVLSKLTLLEGLDLPIHRLNSPKPATTIIQELTYLKCLASLHISISDFEDYLEAIKYVPWDSFKSFSITKLGQNSKQNIHCMGETKVISIEELDICNELSSFCLPNNTEWLDLYYCEIPALSEFQCLKNLRLLKKLYLLGNLVSGNFLVRGEEMEPNALASLEYLSLSKMNGLKAFGEGKLPNGCLANLKVLTVRYCKCFKSLFTLEILQHLKNIETITVDDCGEIEEIVGHGDDGGRVTTTNNIIILPKLRRLKLVSLPKLKSISRETTWVCDSLAELEVFECPKIDARLPFKNLPSISLILGNREWWEALQWDDAETKALLQPYFIDDPSILRSFVVTVL